MSGPRLFPSLHDGGNSAISFAGLALKSRRRQVPATWTLTFADLMMLLLTFFIMLMSMSQLDKQRYTQLVNAISQYRAQVPVPEVIRPTPPVDSPEQRVIKQTLLDLQQEIDAELLHVESKDRQLLIRFQEKAAFASGSEQLTRTFIPVIDKVAMTLNKTRGQIVVSGYTDDQPIANLRYRSNWELSTSRAVSVVHQMLNNTGLDRNRISANGFADTHPLVDNDTVEHRALNRRVEIRVDISVDEAADRDAPGETAETTPEINGPTLETLGKPESSIPLIINPTHRANEAGALRRSRPQVTAEPDDRPREPADRVKILPSALPQALP